METWLPVILFCILWADLIRQLSFEWEAREQYAYGWFVPFFAAGLLCWRWFDRPAPTPCGSPTWMTAVIVLAGLALLPMRVIYEINPDWPLLAWLYTLLVVGGTLYAFFLAGSWLWMRHFAFPVAFILVAVNWPWRIEKSLTQGLMQVVAGLTVELLGWLDVPTLHRGNLIELSTGVVGIDEACSGIRSFQSTLMAGLLMGELYRLRLWARAGLVGCGLVLAFCFNVLRTLLLSWQAGQHGLGTLEKWHDPAGLTITVACFFCLWGIAVLMTRSDQSRAAQLPSVFNFQLSTCNFRPCRRYLLVAGCWSILCVGVTELWYRSHDLKNPGDFCWSVTLPESKPGFQKVELAPRTLKLLAFDSGATGKWHQEGGSEWNVSFFRWRPRSIQSVFHARLHRPEVCLPASGFRQVSVSELVWFTIGNLKLPFRKYIYESEGRNFYVFFCQWEDGAEQQRGMRASRQLDRLQSALTGRRLLGQQTLEIILTGCASLEQAEQEVGNGLPSLIKLAPKA